MWGLFLGGLMVGMFIAAVWVGTRLGNKITDLEEELAKERARRYGA